MKIFKMFSVNDVDLYEDVRIRPLFNTISNIVIVLISTVLATRDFGLAKDDYNYYNYFLFAKNVELDNLLVYFIEEPLWRFYTWAITLVLEPDVAFMFTIFISSLFFLLALKKINSKLIIFVLIVFVLHQDLATQMYFNQLRQGLALSIFLIITTYKRRPILGGFIACLIHTSFVFPLLIIILVLKIRDIKRLVLYSILAILLLYLNINLLQQFDLGRRTNSYLFETKFTLNYYIFTVVRYVPVLFLVQFYGCKDRFNFWYKLALCSFIIIVPFTSFYSAGGRLTYYLSTYFLIMLLTQYKSIGGKLALTYYCLFVVADLFFSDSSVIADWVSILGI